MTNSEGSREKRGPLLFLEEVWYNAGMAEIKAIFHKCEPPETGYWAEVPSLPGCVSEGATLEECKAMIRDAAEGWLESAWELAMRDRKPSVQQDDIVSPVFA